MYIVTTIVWEILDLCNDLWSIEIDIHVGFIEFLEIGSKDFKSARQISLLVCSHQLLMIDYPT